MAKSDLDGKMEQIALKVADLLLTGQEVGKEVNDAFKTLTTYWSAKNKQDKVPDDENSPSSGGFGGIKARLNVVGKE